MNQIDTVTYLDASLNLNDWLVPIFEVIWNVEQEGCNTKIIERCHGPVSNWYQMFILEMLGRL